MDVLFKRMRSHDAFTCKTKKSVESATDPPRSHVDTITSSCWATSIRMNYMFFQNSITGVMSVTVQKTTRLLRNFSFCLIKCLFIYLQVQYLKANMKKLDSAFVSKVNLMASELLATIVASTTVCSFIKNFNLK